MKIIKLIPKVILIILILFFEKLIVEPNMIYEFFFLGSTVFKVKVTTKQLLIFFKKLFPGKLIIESNVTHQFIF